MKFNNTAKAIASITLSHFIIVSPAMASLQTISGTNFDISYESTDFEYFSAPTLSGNVISLLPINFIAKANSVTNPVNEVRDTVNFRIIPKHHQKLSKLELFEFGDYQVNEQGADDSAGASVSGLIAAANPFIANSYTSNFLVTDYNSNTVGIETSAIEDNVLYNWNAKAKLDQNSQNNDPNSDLANWFMGAETVVTVQNILDVYAGVNGPTAFETAYIEKKNATVDIVVTTVPVPPSLWLMLSSLGIFTIRRKKKDFQSNKIIAR